MHRDPENMERYSLLEQNCKVGLCLEECKPILREIFQHPCYAPGLYKMFRGMSLDRTEDPSMKVTLLEHYYKLDSCAAELEKEKCYGNGNDGWNSPEIGGAQGIHLSSTVTLLVTSLLVYFW
jgi:hypothetical protein